MKQIVRPRLSPPVVVEKAKFKGYCFSEGCNCVAAGKTVGRRSVSLSVNITGLVDICFEGPAKEVAT
jgi:hypothetical protein